MQPSRRYSCLALLGVCAIPPYTRPATPIPGSREVNEGQELRRIVAILRRHCGIFHTAEQRFSQNFFMLVFTRAGQTMNTIDEAKRRIKGRGLRIILPEGNDERIRQAAARLS